MKSDLLGEVQFIQNIPTQFYQLLQQTYKMEKKHWEEKKVIAEKELLNARKQVSWYQVLTELINMYKITL